MAVNDKDMLQLCDSTFLSDLAFLIDIMNTLNLQLQSPQQMITMMYNYVNYVLQCVGRKACSWQLCPFLISSGGQ